jgi:hypothetical protein
MRTILGSRHRTHVTEVSFCLVYGVGPGERDTLLLGYDKLTSFVGVPNFAHTSCGASLRDQYTQGAQRDGASLFVVRPQGHSGRGLLQRPLSASGLAPTRPPQQCFCENVQVGLGLK